MKRMGLLDRLRFVSQKRVALFEAAKNAMAEQASPWRERAATELEVRAVEYGLAVQRYLGGTRP